MKSIKLLTFTVVAFATGCGSSTTAPRAAALKPTQVTQKTYSAPVPTAQQTKSIQNDVAQLPPVPAPPAQPKTPATLVVEYVAGGDTDTNSNKVTFDSPITVSVPQYITSTSTVNASDTATISFSDFNGVTIYCEYAGNGDVLFQFKDCPDGEQVGQQLPNMQGIVLHIDSVQSSDLGGIDIPVWTIVQIPTY
jgi:hypothetical protein